MNRAWIVFVSPWYDHEWHYSPVKAFDTSEAAEAFAQAERDKQPVMQRDDFRVESVELVRSE